MQFHSHQRLWMHKFSAWSHLKQREQYCYGNNSADYFRVRSKGQEISEEFFLVFNTPKKKQRNCLRISAMYLAHVIEQPNLRIPNPQYLQLNFCFDFFNDSENTF